MNDYTTLTQPLLAPNDIIKANGLRLRTENSRDDDEESGVKINSNRKRSRCLNIKIENLDPISTRNTTNVRNRPAIKIEDKYSILEQIVFDPSTGKKLEHDGNEDITASMINGPAYGKKRIFGQ